MIEDRRRDDDAPDDRPWMPSKQKKLEDANRAAAREAHRYDVMRQKQRDQGCLIISMIAGILIVLGLCLINPIVKATNIRTVTATVTDKTVKRKDSDDKYLVFTDQDTYEITDSLFMGRFDSSDLYGKIEIGKTYEFEIGGKRVHILSWYPNIYQAKEVTPDE